MSLLTQSGSWQALADHYYEVRNIHMRDLFAQDSSRFDQFSLTVNDILLDYSKNLITAETLALLMDLAHEQGILESVKELFEGGEVNKTEHRPALHTALRNRSNYPVKVNGKDVMPDVNRVLEQMRGFTEQLRNGQWCGYTGKPIRDVVNIGIGGSDLGPLMATEALRAYGHKNLNVHFVSSVDSEDIAQVFQYLNPETTLFIVSSKTFTTMETMTNARTARAWMLEQSGGKEFYRRHFVAVTTEAEAAMAFGIHEENIFEFWDWVGGRYSLCSAIGLSLAIFIGMDQFEEMLMGAHEMDEHFRNAPLAENIPVILAMIGVWYTNFLGMQTHVVLPYDQCLHRFPAFLQQGDMESNGKRVSADGKVLDYDTGPIIWGELGTSGQHAFYQLIHQGTRLISADLMAACHSHNDLGEHHKVLLSNFFAQGEALMRGKTEAEARSEMEQAGLDEVRIEELLPHKVFPGNRPCNMFMYDRLTPRILGNLVALYEHKVFVQGRIWGVDSFDQWGVELGKQLATTILGELDQNVADNVHDSSTNGLMQFYRSQLS
ncbi:MAG: glucose-6-phosphate isomerase [Gammaproteobacteria bacterium]|nr:glucose-6-phosphate isomerase [Gammaproteobacteria bacterium]